MSSCLRLAAERSLVLSGRVSGTAKMRSRYSISMIVRSMFMPFKSGCTCDKHTRIRERIVPCRITCLLSLA